MGFVVSQHGQLGAIPPPPFLSASPLESMRSGGAIPPPPHKKGISVIPARYHMKQGKLVRYPALRYYLEKVLRDMGGGISYWAAKIETRIASEQSIQNIKVASAKAAVDIAQSQV